MACVKPVYGYALGFVAAFLLQPGSQIVVVDLDFFLTGQCPASYEKLVKDIVS